MAEQENYPVPASFKDAIINYDVYREKYKQSLETPDEFWSQLAKEFLTWDLPFSRVSDSNLTTGLAAWFIDGKLNASVNCIDRHLPERAEQTALIWEGDNLNHDQHINYATLKMHVCKLGNALRARGVAKGDRVCIYMPMVPEAVYAMLACARIGAIHSVVFGGFSPEALKERIKDATCTLVITADEGVRGGKTIPLKANVDAALRDCEFVNTVIVLKRTGASIDWVQSRDVWYHRQVAEVSDECEPESMDSEDPLFILYTSGSTGKPKGVLHTTGGYLLHAASTFKYAFDYREGEVFWCTADVGWVTGHSYIVYGPLCNGATSLIFEGVPTFPDGGRCWATVDKHRVNTFFTAPTAIRALHSLGDQWVHQYSRKSLRILGSVGEPINPEAWEWYHRVVGDGRCPIIDSWWQTETGAMMITPLPGAHALKPGYASFPFFGIEPAILDEAGNEIQGEGAGYLVIKRPWPGQIRTVFGDHQRMLDTYFRAHPGFFATGDGAFRDSDGYWRITGRVDDVLNISGHRMGTAEIESALVLHQDIAEAAVVGYPHKIKGQGIYAFVTPMAGVKITQEIRDALIKLCKDEIGAIAKPDIIQWAPSLPKTRSGKIMRRILRKIAANDLNNLGDTSTLADPSVLTELIADRVHN